MENIRFLFNGVKIDNRTGEYIQKRLETIGKLLDNILRIEVEIDLDKKGKFRAEVMVKTPYKLYRSEETTESIEGSIDIVMEELKNQIRKDKTRLREVRERGRRSIKKALTIDKNARF